MKTTMKKKDPEKRSRLNERYSEWDKSLSIIENSME